MQDDLQYAIVLCTGELGTKMGILKFVKKISVKLMFSSGSFYFRFHIEIFDLLRIDLYAEFFLV